MIDRIELANYIGGVCILPELGKDFLCAIAFSWTFFTHAFGHDEV